MIGFLNFPMCVKSIQIPGSAFLEKCNFWVAKRPGCSEDVETFEDVKIMKRERGKSINLLNPGGRRDISQVVQNFFNQQIDPSDLTHQEALMQEAGKTQLEVGRYLGLGQSS